MILTVGIKQKIFLDRNPPIFFTVVCLCATKNRRNYPKNSAQAEFLCFCTRLLVKHEFPDAKAKLCATKSRHNYLKFCAFAKKNRSFFDKPRLQRLPKRSSVPKPQAKAIDRRYQRRKNIPRRKPANSPRIRLRRILEFCAFAKKNAVS